MDKYDFQTQFLLELLEKKFKISIQDLKNKDVLSYVINSDNHESLKLMLIKISRKDFDDSFHKKNYTLKSILNQSKKH